LGVIEAARVLELEPYLERKPRQLSGGQRQRVAMGRAIVRQPRAFLMDEPLSNLDAKLRVQMRAEIGQLQRSLGTTTIYVTHDQTEAMTLGTRVAVLSGGELQQLAPPAELYRRPSNLFVAGFIGSPPMNLIDATLERGGAPASSNSTWPEAVSGPHRHDGSVLELPISLREELGSEVHLHCAIGKVAHATRPGAEDVRSLATLVAKTDPRTSIAVGQTAKMAVAVDRLHFFDPVTWDSIRR
jgi:multiple sugar transport system ATP-binding protein